MKYKNMKGIMSGTKCTSTQAIKDFMKEEIQKEQGQDNNEKGF